VLTFTVTPRSCLGTSGVPIKTSFHTDTPQSSRERCL
jgi:hypothetical protein